MHVYPTQVPYLIEKVTKEISCGLDFCIGLG